MVLWASALLGVATACSVAPSDQELRSRTTLPATEQLRSAEERKIRELIERMGAVEGLELVRAHVTDSCVRSGEGSVFDSGRPPYVLTCSMRAVAYFGVRGSVAEALPRIREADIAVWGPQDGKGRDVPHAAGTITYALDYLRHGGRTSDGSKLPSPVLDGPGIDLDWERPDDPLSVLVTAESPTPCPPASEIYRRCWVMPDSPMSMATARSRNRTFLTVTVGGPESTAYDYFTVRRQ
ncbi:hypothetical protein [Streptomyces sp. NPDC093089]|uniref:hypothetical protein n=1 Tax=Streptomyces sp. NPDC093089 TaxID=3366024 RepID=UPI003826E9C5